MIKNLIGIIFFFVVFSCRSSEEINSGLENSYKYKIEYSLVRKIVSYQGISQKIIIPDGTIIYDDKYTYQKCTRSFYIRENENCLLEITTGKTKQVQQFDTTNKTSYLSSEPALDLQLLFNLLSRKSNRLINIYSEDNKYFLGDLSRNVDSIYVYKSNKQYPDSTSFVGKKRSYYIVDILRVHSFDSSADYKSEKIASFLKANSTSLK